MSEELLRLKRKYGYIYKPQNEDESLFKGIEVYNESKDKKFRIWVYLKEPKAWETKLSEAGVAYHSQRHEEDSLAQKCCADLVGSNRDCFSRTLLPFINSLSSSLNLGSNTIANIKSDLGIQE